MSGQNTLIPNLTMNGRKEYVKQADINYLVKGVALLAGGILYYDRVVLSGEGLPVLCGSSAVCDWRSFSVEVL